MSPSGFDVHLENFEGPFDLLLQLISRREMDVTRVALSKVTDEFIAHVAAAGDSWPLDQTSSFLLVAATLLDMKAARLLPGGEVTEPEDLAALEARDLLFARLLQYRAFKVQAAWIEQQLAQASHLLWRPGGMEDRFVGVLPEVELTITADQLAVFAASALTPKPQPTVALTHLHGSSVSVAQETALVAKRLRADGAATFRALVAGCEKLVVVVRFLAILELYRGAHVTFEQASPLGELSIRWVSDADVDLAGVDEYDMQEES